MISVTVGMSRVFFCFFLACLVFSLVVWGGFVFGRLFFVCFGFVFVKTGKTEDLRQRKFHSASRHLFAWISCSLAFIAKVSH